MNNILNTILIFFLSIITLSAFFAVLGVFFSKRLAQTSRLISERPGRSFLLGLVNAVFFSILALVISHIGSAQNNNFLNLVAIVLAAVLLIGVSFGLAAVVEIVSERLFPASQGLWRTAAGTAMVALACAAPVVGWFALLPFTLFSGMGGFILSFFSLPSERTAGNVAEKFNS